MRAEYRQCAIKSLLTAERRVRVWAVTAAGEGRGGLDVVVNLAVCPSVRLPLNPGESVAGSDAALRASSRLLAALMGVLSPAGGVIMTD